MTNPIDKAQPEALRLAEWLEEAATIADMGRKPLASDHRRRAAAELRRLHYALAAAEARNATLTDDAARWQWIAGARTEEEATACVVGGPPPVLPQDEVISTLGGWYFHKELADSLVDAAMARAAASIGAKEGDTHADR